MPHKCGIARLTLLDRSSIITAMNVLTKEQQAQVIAALVGGSSIRSVERMTGIHRDTIMRLMVRVGDGCDRVMDEMMRGLTCERLQLDEIWAYVGMKQKTAKAQGKVGEFGDAYTFVAIDADTKLVPCWSVARRTWSDTAEFIEDLRGRIDSPTFQRFVYQDPIGFRRRSPNLYGYVSNNPMNLVDHLGLEFRGIQTGRSRRWRWI
jgi:RHS repeat-associated protein